jgi:hypothetical protein
MISTLFSENNFLTNSFGKQFFKKPSLAARVSQGASIRPGCLGGRAGGDHGHSRRP